MGIRVRLAMLERQHRDDTDKLQMLRDGYERLIGSTDKGGMGELYRVWCVGRRSENDDEHRWYPFIEKRQTKDLHERKEK